MADTLVEPVPPTQRDGQAPEPSDGQPPEPAPPEPAPPEPVPPARRSRKQLIAAVVISLGGLLIGVALAVYLLVWRYEPSARAHIPGNANLAARIEVADIVLFAPVRKHLWSPLFDSPFASGGAPGKTRAQRIREATGVNVYTDLREIVLASVDATSWVVLLGGKIPRGRFVEGISRLAAEEGWPGVKRSGELLMLSTGAAMGQADDGTIVIGTDTAIVMASLPASEEWTRLGLAEQGAVTFAMTKEAWNGAAGTIAKRVPGGQVLSQIQRATGRMTLGNAPELSVRLEPSTAGGAPALAGDIESLLGRMKLILLFAPDVAGEKAALGAAQVRVDGAVVAVQAPWPYEGLDKGCDRLAGLVDVLSGE